ncbi:MAG: AAA family ATPase, partial [Thermoplasmata archaeon]|nr:AAA family ATPase [Thermoplasmata archaeon]
MPAREFQFGFVDRETEIGMLRESMKDAMGGHGSTILITGDIGVGKTRLAEEFGKICEKEGFAVLFSICLGNKEPAYLPVLSALQQYARKVREQDEIYVPLGLAGFQSMEIEEQNPEGMTRERTRILEHLLQQLTEISRRVPVLLIIDDIHLADSATLSFFHHVARNIMSERIVVLATYVEEYASAETAFGKTLRNMNIERLCKLLKLANFGMKETQLLVQQTGFAQPEEVAKYIYDRTSGNPFFVIEFLTAIQNAGLNDIVSIRNMKLPDTVKDLVKFRVTKLSERARKVLATCAVLGRVFEYGALVELAGLKEEELLDSIDELVSQNFLVETEEFDEGYKFVSNTAHEVVYGELSGSRKRIMHQKAGEILEKLHGDDERYWSALANHYKMSNNKGKFVEYAVKAGRSAA